VLPPWGGGWRRAPYPQKIARFSGDPCIGLEGKGVGLEGKGVGLEGKPHLQTWSS